MNISYTQANMLSNLTRSYLNGEVETESLYAFPSTSENVIKVISQREKRKQVNRSILVDSLLQQYKDIPSQKAIRNIKLLSKQNTYTVTTGHQLNIFTGPLYFIYKIVSAIETAKLLNKEHPNFNFIPVYWMATEDHDFDEINHTYMYGEKVEFESNQTGMVGTFSTELMQETVDQFCASLGDSVRSDELSQRIKTAYLNHDNLARATQDIVHSIFGDYGLVIMDANQPELKREFSEVIEQELRKNVSFHSVNKTIQQWDERFKAQVTPREINLFYALEGIRERIISTQKGFEINNTEICFSTDEILEELKLFPERFSPNVILRPVYQECILPNVVYIGGGAEVAYWLELKSTFDAFSISYPLLQIRSSFLCMSSKAIAQLKGLELNIQDVFMDRNTVDRKITDRLNPLHGVLQTMTPEMNAHLDALKDVFSAYDTQLISSLEVAKCGVEKSINRLNTKMNRSVRRKNEIILNRLDRVFEWVYPNGIFQERIINYFEMSMRYGDTFLDQVFDQTEPFCTDIRVWEI